MSTATRARPTPRVHARFEGEGGGLVFVEQSHAIPLVDVSVIIRAGALADPREHEGLTRMAARMLRMGTRRLRADQVEDAIDGMGATMSIDVSHGSMRVHASVIRRSLEPFLELLAELLAAPAVRDDDLEQVRREVIADLVSQRDNDRWLAARAFRAELFGAHPYGRPAMGTPTSIARIRRKDVRAHLSAMVRRGDVLVGLAGDVTTKDAERLGRALLARLPEGRAPVVELAAPSVRRGRRVVIVDKPERTQTQIYMGTLGARLGERAFYPLLVANTAFGGTFSARLTRAVRSERGWSYSAHSRLGADREREAWSLYTHPSRENAVDCVSLELELVSDFVARGVTEDETAFAKSFLVKSHAFDVDTASKRLEPRLEAALHDLPASFHERYVQHVSAVDRARASSAVASRLSSDDLVIAIVATAKDVADRVHALPGVSEVSIVPFDAE